MDEFGGIVIYEKYKMDIIHHSSLNRGKPVAAAGYRSIEDGFISSLDMFSVHYKPQISEFEQIITELNRREADLSHILYLPTSYSP